MSTGLEVFSFAQLLATAPPGSGKGDDPGGKTMVRIVTVREVATLLQLKESTVCSLAAEGKLPGFKLGKSWRFDLEEVERWIAGMPRSGKGHLESGPEA
jgi:excisionase family DNA binding protein